MFKIRTTMKDIPVDNTPSFVSKRHLWPVKMMGDLHVLLSYLKENIESNMMKDKE